MMMRIQTFVTLRKAYTTSLLFCSIDEMNIISTVSMKEDWRDRDIMEG
jgi:hypothetical protein